MILYIDSLFAEGRDRVVELSRVVPETLTKLYLMAMREHARTAVVKHREGDRWLATPDWRFDRQVIRLALYLREQAGVEVGERVAIISEPRPEWLVVDFAAIGMRAVSVALSPSVSGGELVAALVSAGPKVAFVSGKAREHLRVVRDRIATLEHVYSLDALPTHEDGVEQLGDALELGGTLDTPERAQNFRYYAREHVTPEQPAIRHYVTPFKVRELTQADVVEGVKSRWFEDAARTGDQVYVAAPAVSLALRLQLYAFLGDGNSTVVFGTPGNELEEIAELRPEKIIASPAVLATLVQRGLAETDSNGRGFRDLIRRVTRLTRRRRERQMQDAVSQALGGARWVGPTAPLDAAISERLGAVAVVGAETYTKGTGGGA